MFNYKTIKIILSKYYILEQLHSYLSVINVAELMSFYLFAWKLFEGLGIGQRIIRRLFTTKIPGLEFCCNFYKKTSLPRVWHLSPSIKEPPETSQTSLSLPYNMVPRGLRGNPIMPRGVYCLSDSR